MTHIDHLDYEFKPGSVTCSPVLTPWPEWELDKSAKRFMLCGPPELDVVQTFASELVQDTQVRSVEVKPDNSFRPPRIDVLVRVIDVEAWEAGEHPNPEEPDGDSVSLANFISGSLRSIAQPYAEK